MSVQRLTALVERAQEKRGDLGLAPLPAWRRVQLPSLEISVAALDREGNSAAAYGCVTPGQVT